MISTEDYSFYTVNSDYLEYLNSVDSEVYYNNIYRERIKPFIGVIINIEDYKYFIPLTSAKPKHKKWKTKSKEHFTIYEVVNNDLTIKGDIYKEHSDTQKLHLLAILDIKKMIPVPDGEYHKIIFKSIEDKKYTDLLKKEYKFCLKIKDKVLKTTEKLYRKQKETGNVEWANCNFTLLESAMNNWEAYKSS